MRDNSVRRDIAKVRPGLEGDIGPFLRLGRICGVKYRKSACGIGCLINRDDTE
jgi:hypothetical protein